MDAMGQYQGKRVTTPNGTWLCSGTGAQAIAPGLQQEVPDALFTHPSANGPNGYHAILNSTTEQRRQEISANATLWDPAGL